MNKIYVIQIESGFGEDYALKSVGFCKTEDDANKIRDDIKNKLIENHQHYINYTDESSCQFIYDGVTYWIGYGADCFVTKINEL